MTCLISSICWLVMPTLNFLKVLSCMIRTLLVFFIWVPLISFASHVALRSCWVSIIRIWIIRVWSWISLSHKIVYDVFKSFSGINLPVSQCILHRFCLFQFIQICFWIIWALSWMLLLALIFKFYFCFHLRLRICWMFLTINDIITYLSMGWPILRLYVLCFWQVREIPVLLWNFGLIVLHFSRKIWKVRIILINRYNFNF